MTRLRRLAVLAAFAAAAPAAAQDPAASGGFRADPDAPVEVEANELSLDQASGLARFSGGVVVTQGELRLTAPEILVEYARTAQGAPGRDVSSITASGGVLLVTPTEAAEAETARYSPAENSIVMTGDVVLTQGANTLTGDRLVVDLATGTGRVEGRVRTILQPGTEP